MKELRFFFAIALLSIGSAGCSTSFLAADSGSFSDDLYATHDRAAIARQQQAEAEAARAQAEARKAEWEARLAEAEAQAAQNSYENYTYQSVLADTYESAYARRLRGFESPTYNMPSSYYELRYSPAYQYVTAYDPMNYNIIVMGDQVWVEPKYITSMFGTWGAPSVSVSIYAGYPYSSWYSSWGWGWPYTYSWWGYPHYSWYDWGWGYPGWGYPGWGWGYPHHHPGWGYPPHDHHNPPHYANYRPWGGSSGYRGRPGGVRHSSPYTSPRDGGYRQNGSSGNYRGHTPSRGPSTAPAGNSNYRRNQGTGTPHQNNSGYRQNSRPEQNRNNSGYRQSSPGSHSSGYRSPNSGSGGGYRGGSSGGSGHRSSGSYRR